MGEDGGGGAREEEGQYTFPSTESTLDGGAETTGTWAAFFVGVCVCGGG